LPIPLWSIIWWRTARSLPRRANADRHRAEDAIDTILIADDHPLFRQALALAVGAVAPAARVIEAGTLAAAARAASAVAQAPDQVLRLILLDLKMPGAVGYSGIALLHAECPGVPILVVSSAEGASAADEARAFGAVGFLRKDADLSAIEAAIADALGGLSRPAPALEQPVDSVRKEVAQLTPTQLKVLLAVLQGKLNKQIAHDLAMSEATVKAHMTAIMRKLDVHNRTQAALAARALGLDLAH
jgi:DNA-binding NarL/FixJ family response regulator